jgi:hypothetical protein
MPITYRPTTRPSMYMYMYRSRQGVSAGEGRHPSLQPAGFFRTRGSQFERQCHTLAEIARSGVDAIRLPCFIASWFLSTEFPEDQEQSWKLLSSGRRRVNGYVCGQLSPFLHLWSQSFPPRRFLPLANSAAFKGTGRQPSPHLHFPATRPKGRCPVQVRPRWGQTK